MLNLGISQLIIVEEYKAVGLTCYILRNTSDSSLHLVGDFLYKNRKWLMVEANKFTHGNLAIPHRRRQIQKDFLFSVTKTN